MQLPVSMFNIIKHNHWNNDSKELSIAVSNVYKWICNASFLGWWNFTCVDYSDVIVDYKNEARNWSENKKLSIILSKIENTMWKE